MKPDFVMCLQSLKERIKVFCFRFKKLPDVRHRLREINEDMALVFMLCEFLSYIALTDTPRPLDQQSARSLISDFPVKQLVIYFSSDLHSTPP